MDVILMFLFVLLLIFVVTINRDSIIPLFSPRGAPRRFHGHYKTKKIRSTVDVHKNTIIIWNVCVKDMKRCILECYLTKFDRLRDTPSPSQTPLHSKRQPPSPSLDRKSRPLGIHSHRYPVKGVFPGRGDWPLVLFGPMVRLCSSPFLDPEGVESDI